LLKKSSGKNLPAAQEIALRAIWRHARDRVAREIALDMLCGRAGRPLALEQAALTFPPPLSTRGGTLKISSTAENCLLRIIALLSHCHFQR
jgi:hypothetical protein